MSGETYAIQRETITQLLEIAQRAHARATSSPFWYLASGQPEIKKMLAILNQIDQEVKAQCITPLK